MDGWMDGWTDERMDGWMNGWIDGWIGEWMDGRMNNGWQMNGHTNTLFTLDTYPIICCTQDGYINESGSDLVTAAP